MTDLRRISSVATASGRMFCLADPRPEDICIEDIATHLSRIARFTGAAYGRYSVAQHSVLVAARVGPPHQKHALMHDAAEAYVGDVSAPLKRLAREFRSTFFDELEHKVWLAIAKRFGLDPNMPAEVHIADRRMCATEQRALTKTPEGWCEPDPYTCYRHEHGEWSLGVMGAAAARVTFLERYRALWGTP